MNKNDFINRLLVKFMTNAETTQAKIISEDLDNYLPATIDFDYLYDKVILEYPQKSMPAISWLKQHFRTAKEYENEKAVIYWTVWAKTDDGKIYEFSCEPKESVVEVKKWLREKKPFPLTYVKDNRDEIRLTYGI